MSVQPKITVYRIFSQFFAICENHRNFSHVNENRRAYRISTKTIDFYYVESKFVIFFAHQWKSLIFSIVNKDREFFRHVNENCRLFPIQHRKFSRSFIIKNRQIFHSLKFVEFFLSLSKINDFYRTSSSFYFEIFRLQKSSLFTSTIYFF